MPKQRLLTTGGGGGSKERERGKNEKTTKQQALLTEPSKERRTAAALTPSSHSSSPNTHAGRSNLRTGDNRSRRQRGESSSSLNRKLSGGSSSLSSSRTAASASSTTIPAPSSPRPLSPALSSSPLPPASKRMRCSSSAPGRRRQDVSSPLYLHTTQSGVTAATPKEISMVQDETKKNKKKDDEEKQERSTRQAAHEGKHPRTRTRGERGGGEDGKGSDEDDKHDKSGGSASSPLSTRNMRDQEKASQGRSEERVLSSDNLQKKSDLHLHRNHNKGTPHEERKTKKGEKEESDPQRKANEVDTKKPTTQEGFTSKQVTGRSRLLDMKKACQEDEKERSLHEKKKNIRENGGGSRREMWRKGQLQQQEKEDDKDHDVHSPASSSSKSWRVTEEGTSKVRSSQMNRKKKQRTGEGTEEGSSCPAPSLNHLHPHSVRMTPSSDVSDSREEEEDEKRKENLRRIDGGSHENMKALSLVSTPATRERRRRGREAEPAAEQAASLPSSVSPYVEKEREGERQRRKQEKKKEGMGKGKTEKGGGEEEEEAGAVVNLLKSEVPNTVFKVFCTHCEPNYSQPWTTRRQTTSTSTGFVTVDANGDRCLLTNAHSVEHAAVVQVRKRGDHQKYEAKVVCIGLECDLAMLQIADEDFWQGVGPPLQWGPSPLLEDPVTVVGYPLGGDNSSVTQGVVSRMDLQQYSLGSCSLLAIQIDAAINPGNSGGPALNKHRQCVGIAFQSLKDGETENIGYIIPSEVVRHFLEDYKRHSRYLGFGDGGFTWQKLENKFCRQALGLKEKHEGILVKKVDGASTAKGVLQKGDILLEIGGQRIASDGTVPFRNGERILFTWLFSQMFVGDICHLKLIRNHREMSAQFTVGKLNLLVPANSDLRRPEYLIVGGLVFVPLSEPFLKSEYGEDFESRAPVRLLDKWQHGVRSFPEEQYVLLTHVLAHDITVGYEHIHNTQVKAFNGTAIKTLNHLAEMVEKSQDEHWRFDLDHDEVVILHAPSARAALPEILTHNMIPSHKSERV